VPRDEELVAIGAAVQAAAILTGEDPAGVAARWETNAGVIHEPLPRDDERLGRIGALRSALIETPVLAGTAD
jgi:xylulokinase